MDIIVAILQKLAFWQPLKFSNLDKYLQHQHVLQETEIDKAGNLPEFVKDTDFPSNPNLPHTFTLVPGTVIHQKLKQPIQINSL
jgi:hypothetical protein